MTPQAATDEASGHRRPPPQGSYLREGRGLEFDRVSFFNDAVFAIVMTLLVVELRVPHLAGGIGPRQPLDVALWDQRYAIFGFFLGFVLLGRFWLAHHRFVASLRSIDQRLISLNLLYLAFVALTPYPVSLISEYEKSPTAFCIFAVCMAVINFLEVVMLLWAEHHGHSRVALTRRAMRLTVAAALMPVVVMVVSLPLATVSTTLALLSWTILISIGAFLHHRMTVAGLATT